MFLVIGEKPSVSQIMEDCSCGQVQVVSVVKEEKTIFPPRCYDLTTLQRDANRIFGFTAKETLEYLQSLYEKSWQPTRGGTASFYQTIWGRQPGR